MIHLFNKLLAASLPIVPKPIVRKVSERYIAGATLNDAIATIRKLNALGAMATVDILGEFISSREEAIANTTYSLEVIQRLYDERLDCNLSIKLTSLALGLDNALCENNVRLILGQAQKCGNMFVRTDMENSPYTTLTIDLYKKLRREYSNIGVVLQAYLKRTQDDIRGLLADSAPSGIRTNVRLCKGIYREDPDIAFQDRMEIQQHYLESLELLLSGGAYVGIATHDDLLISEAKRMVEAHKLTKDAFEFQMLLGVRDEARNATIREGYRLRVYVPFGADWYGYSLRRLKENPAMAGHIVKAMFGMD